MIYGGLGNDVLSSEGSSNLHDLYGGDGNDNITLTIFSSNAHMIGYGDAGADTLTAKSNGTNSATSVFVQLYGGSGDDKFYAPSACAGMSGEGDNDTFTAENGLADLILGDAGYDTVLSHDINPGGTTSADLIQNCEVIN